MVSPSFSFFATAASSSSERDRFGRLRNAGGELLQRRAEMRGVGGELLQRFLRREPLVFDDLPLRLVDLTQAVVALEVRREQAENDAVRHHDVGDVLQAASLGL